MTTANTTFDNIRNRAAATSAYDKSNTFSILCLLFGILLFCGIVGISTIDRNVNDFSSILSFYGLHIVNICRAIIGA